MVASMHSSLARAVNTWLRVSTYLLLCRLGSANQNSCSPAGGDDKRVLLWNVDQALGNVTEDFPAAMYGEHASNIFCLGFDTLSKYVFSGGNDDLVIQHDLCT